jgi:type IV pilus modification protein PilV
MKQKEHLCAPLRALKQQRGVAMLEVLITFFVLSIGLTGLAVLQTKAVAYNQGAYQHSQATIAAYSMLDSMRLNGGKEPSAADKTAWEALLTKNGATGTSSCDTADTSLCKVTITWADHRSSANKNTQTKQTVTVTSRL